MHDQRSDSRLASSLARKRYWAHPGPGVLVPCHSPNPPAHVDEAVQGNGHASHGVWGVVWAIYRALRPWVFWVDSEPLSEEEYEEEKELVGGQIVRLQQEHEVMRHMLDEDRERCGDLVRRIGELRGEEYMREQDRFQMEALMKDKAQLMAENDDLGRELRGLQDVLEYTLECFADENKEPMTSPGAGLDPQEKS